VPTLAAGACGTGALALLIGQILLGVIATLAQLA
jgi:hypothetical protein